MHSAKAENQKGRLVAADSDDGKISIRAHLLSRDHVYVWRQCQARKESALIRVGRASLTRRGCINLRICDRLPRRVTDEAMNDTRCASIAFDGDGKYEEQYEDCNFHARAYLFNCNDER